MTKKIQSHHKKERGKGSYLGELFARKENLTKILGLGRKGGKKGGQKNKVGG